MNSSNSNDVIEISDDSNDFQGSNSGTSSLQGTKRQHSTVISDSSSDSTSDSDDDVEWVENDSESEPSDVECDTWDKDCSISDVKPKTEPIFGFHLMPTCSRDPETRSKKAKRSIELSKTFTDDDFKKLLKDNFDNGNAYSDKTCEIISDPWKVLVLNDLLQDVAFLEEVRREMYEIAWNRRSMDLYEFFQSEDLKKVEGESIGAIFEFLKTDLRSWVERLTGLEIVEVSATCSFYGDTDFLVVHDDQRENRAVAFVLYLSGAEGWNRDWGGALQLFDRDGGGQPDKCTRSIIPKNNQLVLFPVSDCSYHQVEEVTCKNFSRMSINGWFHVKEPLKFEAPLYIPPARGLFSDAFENFSNEEVNLNDWVDNGYLSEDVKQTVHYYIEESSEYSLETFFNETKMSRVCESITDKDIKWERMGPPNRRNYEYISTADLPPIIDDFIRLFKSEKFAHLLKEYTELDLTKMRWELQKWTPGCYSLLEEHKTNQLDVVVFLGKAEVIGGKINYVTLDDEVQTALVTIPPSSDESLNLVYGDTARFTSFVSRHTKSSPYYMLVAAYFEDEGCVK